MSAKDLDYRYLTIKVEKDDLAAALNGVRAFNMRGINLTIPQKVDALHYLDELSDAAQIIGAVNMVVNNNGMLWGENTDGKGFLISLQNEGVSVIGKKITILGAGGAARAISVECALAGAKEIIIVNIDQKQGEDLIQLLNTKTSAQAKFILWDHTIRISEDTDILINATSIGLYPNVHEKPNVEFGSVLPSMIVCDVIFNDPNTLFLHEAKNNGAKTINGLGMLVNQGALNFKLWTGVEAPVELMVETLKREFNLI